MKKMIHIATAAVLAGVSYATDAWWGPYGVPYGVGYAPAYALPVVSPYGYGLTQDQINELASRQQKAVEQWSKVGYAPWGYGPYAPWGGAPHFGRAGNFLNNPFMTSEMQEMFQQSEEERTKAIQESEARRAAFRARVEAQRAAIEARRAAWLASVGGYPPPTTATGATVEPVAAEPANSAAEPEQAEPAAAEPAKAQ